MIYRGQGGLLNLSLEFHICDECLFCLAIGSCHCSEMSIRTIQLFYANVKAVCIELLLYCEAVACVPRQNSTHSLNQSSPLHSVLTSRSCRCL